MSIPYFTLVVGVDEVHLKQLAWTYPTWQKHKPSLMKRPMVIFYDRQQVEEKQIQRVVKSHKGVVSLIPWPPPGVSYERQGDDRFGHPQRYKMLSGFIHVPPMVVTTPYWLKLDTDVIATEQDDWINPSWFAKQASIISHPWGFTKPADQMLQLDQWVEDNKKQLPILSRFEPLNLTPEPGWERLRHPRIISYVCFCATHVTRLSARWARETCGEGQLPCPSQDGYMWYVAKRLGHEIVRVKMKDYGWVQRHTMENVRIEARKALQREFELERQDAE